MADRRRIRIGTRSSTLATWQAEYIQGELGRHGIESELVFIQSAGDIDLVQPLYAMGIQGVFTKALDTALLNDQIDLAVHSLKDVPTKLAAGLSLIAVPPRGEHRDMIVMRKNQYRSFKTQTATVATSSLRRKAQWLHRFPHHRITGLRGNIQTRLKKLNEHPDWDGAIFAAVGPQRIGMQVESLQMLDWMIPAPGQGALAVVAREDDHVMCALRDMLNHEYSDICTGIERTFLNRLAGGCAVPIAAFTEIDEGQVKFIGNVLSLDGKRKSEVQLSAPFRDWKQLGEMAAQELLSGEGGTIIDALRNAPELKKTPTSGNH